MKTKKGGFGKSKVLVILVLALFINLPLISALEMSNIQTESVTDNSALVKWETDEPADTFLNYGEDKENLQKIGDAKETTEHQVFLSNLVPEKEYYFSVESDDLVDDNSGDLYSFTTLPPDLTAPELSVELPEMVPGAKFDLVGWTEPGVEVNLYVNDALAGSTIAINEEDLGQSFGVESNVEVIETEEETDETDETVVNEVADKPLTGEAFGFGETTTSKPTGKFEFLNIFIEKDIENIVRVEVIDSSGNKAEFSGSVFSDSTKPVLTLKELPEVFDDNSLQIEGTISEESTFEIFVNEESEVSGEGTEIKESISLNEGENNIKIVIKDIAGWETVEEFKILSDTKAPSVSFKIEKGNEYYQGKMLTPSGGYESKAQSNINGETEPGADVYLYVHRPVGFEDKPSFKRALAKVTADENGDFTFSNVDFEDQTLSLEDLAPKEVPAGLLQFSTFSSGQMSEEQDLTYYIFVIAEDKSGKSGYAQTSITLHTCYSANFDFDIQSLAQFQRPLRLDPGLLDDGREEATAVFNLTYRGDGVPKIDYATGAEIEPAFKISSVTFDRACTNTMMDDESTKLGCNILPPYPRATSNADDTAWYTTFDLRSAEKLSDRDSDFWNEFKKRQLVFPLKVRVSYSERDATGAFTLPKTQTSCFDLSYFVDIPIESKEMLPDWLADEGITAIQGTIETIDKVLPYLEDAIIVAGWSCISSFLLRMITRWVRLTFSMIESYSSTVKKVAGAVGGTDDKPECPVPAEQSKLLLKSTIKDWTDMGNLIKQPRADPGANPNIYGYKKKNAAWNNEDYSLDNSCPRTATLWEAEAILDQAYRWTCDRLFCRTVPAGWTSTEDETQIQSVVVKQQQCTISSKGIPLQEIEDCQKFIEANAGVVTAGDVKNIVQRIRQSGSTTCYRYNERLYIVSETHVESPTEDGQVVYLDRVPIFGAKLGDNLAFSTPDRLIAYRPPNSDQFIVGQDKSCQAACKSQTQKGYAFDKEGGVSNIAGPQESSQKNGCYYEEKQGTNIILKNDNGNSVGQRSEGELSVARYSAGYTKDCFVDLTSDGNAKEVQGDRSGLLQCVCRFDENKPEYKGVRHAAKEVGTEKENWIYRQDALFRENSGTRGTYYSKLRYYTGRDLSSAFGADYLLDYLPGRDKEAHQVDPHTFIGAYQTFCLSGVRAHLVMLQSILQGLSTCIEEAKYTGLRDAGVCKTVFAQHVCGLTYKALAYFYNDCSPINMGDQQKSSGGAFDELGYGIKAGFQSIGTAMGSSISDIQQDYGNAQLNQFFATGVQGFTQSICMAAFGYDFPLGMDFILDSAYAFQTKTTVMSFPAEREQATFNPQKGTAVYNYNIGALIFPGCKIRSADVYLTCIGPEDQNRPGVQCGEQGCDCLHITDASSPFAPERVRAIEQGRLFDIKQGSMVDMKIPAPQKIDSNYRYDHVLVELKLDPYESAENCFDEGYRDGKFYFPITDISPSAEFVCQVQASSGRYFCPEVQELFGGGVSAYLESPFMTCHDDKTDSWINCNTPGLFTKDDQIRVKVHVNSDGGQYCLKTNVVGIPGLEGDRPAQPLPVYLPGPGTYEIAGLGIVEESYFGASGTNLVLASPPLSAADCSHPVPVGNNPPATNQALYSFRYEPVGDKYRIYLPNGVDPITPGYLADDIVSSQGGRKLLKGGVDVFDAEEIKAITFSFPGGLNFRSLVGGPKGEVNKCVYQVTTPLASAQNQKSISITSELLQPDAGGSCFNAKTPVKKSAFGVTKHREDIILQLDTLAAQQTNKYHQSFLNDKCDQVLQETDAILRREESDLEDALAIYYTTACFVLQGGNDWRIQSKTGVCNMLDVFFNRHYVIGDRYTSPYPDEVKNKVEFKKIEKYLEEIGNEAKCDFSG